MPFNCDPNFLIAAARCFSCIPSGLQRAVQINSLCNIVNGASTPPTPPPTYPCGAPSNLILISGAGTPAANQYYQSDGLGTWFGQTNGNYALVFETGAWHLKRISGGPVQYYYTSTAAAFPCSWTIEFVGVAPAPTGVYETVTPLFYSPATAVATWTDAGGNHSGNLSTFNSTASFHSVTYLNLEGQGLTSISGFTSLTSLSSLYVDSNNLVSLDCSGLSALLTLNCSNNLGMASLTLTGCTSLGVLDFSFTGVTSVNLSGLLSLDQIISHVSALTSLAIPAGLTLSNGISSYSCSHLSSVSFGAGCHLSGGLDCSTCLVLTNVALNGLTFDDVTAGALINLAGGALNQGSVNAALSLAHVQGFDGGTPDQVFLDGGTNAPPTGGNLNPDYVFLVGNGVTVTIN